MRKLLFIFAILYLLPIGGSAQNIRSAWGDFGIADIADTIYTLSFRSFYGGTRDLENSWRDTDFQVGDVVWVNCLRYPITGVEAGDPFLVQINVANQDPPQPGDRGFITAENMGAGGRYAANPPTVSTSGGGGVLLGLPPEVGACITNYYNLELSEANHAPFRTGMAPGTLGGFLVTGSDTVEVYGSYLDVETDGTTMGLQFRSGDFFTNFTGDGLAWTGSALEADVKSIAAGSGVTVADTNGVWTIHSAGGGSSGVRLPVKSYAYITDTAGTDGAMVYCADTYTGVYVYNTALYGWQQVAAHGASTGGNTVSEERATVGGGGANTASSYSATVSGGNDNFATAQGATVGGGFENWATGVAASVAGGNANFATGNRAAIIGGEGNTASGVHCAVIGGISNTASATYSLASGSQATASNYGEVAHNNGVAGFGYSTLLFTRDIAEAEDAVTYSLYLDGSGASATLPSNGFFRVTCDWFISRGAYQEATSGTFSQNIKMVSGGMTLETLYAVESSGATLGIEIVPSGATFLLQFTAATPYLGPVKAAAKLEIIKIAN